MDITIIIPVKEEHRTIEKVIKQLKNHVKKKAEVFIVYDSPDDPTKPAAETYIQKNEISNFFVIKNSVGNKKGVINAIKTGLAKAKGKAVVFTMADLSDDIKQIDRMYQMIENGYDIIAASRYMPGGKKIGGPFLKTFLSKTAGLTLHKVFGLPTHDATNAYKMYRRSIFKSISIQSTGGFEYSLEITLKAFKKGYKITEIPTVWHDDPKGKSHFRLMHWLPKYIETYALIFFQNEKPKKSHKK